MSFNRYFLVSLAILPLALTACEKPQEKEAKYLKEGNELFSKGDYVKARLDYKNAAQIMPNDAEPRYRLGLVDEAENDTRNAFANFIAAEQQNKHYKPALLKLANYFLAAGEYDEADHRLSTVLRDDAKEPEGHALRAAILLRRNDFDGTEKEANVALAEDPSNVTAISVLTGLYVAQKNEARAESVLEAGIKQNPNEMPLLLLRVAIYEHEPDISTHLEKIDAAYQAIFKQKADSEAFRVDLAKIYLAAGKKSEAEKTLRDGVAAMPDNWAMKKDLANFLSEAFGLDAAEKEIRGYMQSYPTNEKPYFWLADLYASHNAPDRAQQLLEHIINKESIDDTSLNARTTLARIQFIKGDKTLADKLISFVLSKEPSNQEALFIRAQISFGQANYQDAISDLRSILRDNPKLAPALQLLAETLLIQGHLDLAADTQAQLIAIDPTNPSAAVRFAQLLILSGNDKRGMEILENTTRVTPNFAIGWENLARTSISTQSWEKAEFAISKLDTLPEQHPLVLFLRGQLASAIGKNADALPFYVQVFSADPTTPIAEHALSAYVENRQSLNELPDTVAVLRQLKSDTAFIDTLIGGCLAKLGDTQKAEIEFQKAIAEKPSSQDPYIGLAKIFNSENKADQAISILKSAILHIPSDVNAYLILANTLEKTAKYNEAVSVYRDLLAHFPENNVAANNMVQVIADHMSSNPDELDNALKVAKRFAGSNDPLYLDTLGWVYIKLGSTQQAEIIMERVMSSKKELPYEIHYHYGSLLIKLGKFAEAKKELTYATGPGASYSGLLDAKKLLATL